MNSIVSIIVLNYNTSEKAVKCVQSIYKKVNYPNYTVTLVDSSYSQEERDYLMNNLPEYVDLLLLKDNKGYTGGNNEGIKRVQKKFNPDYIVLLNADAEILDGSFVKKLVDFMEKNPRVGLAGPLVFKNFNNEVQNTVLQFPFLKRLFFNWFTFRIFRGLLPHSRKFKRPSLVELLNGVCIMIRKEVFQTCGFFNESYFMYVEDADFQYRMKKMGWEVAFVPVKSIVHLQNPNDYSLTSPVSRLLRRNAFFFQLTYSYRLSALIYVLLTFLLFIGRGFMDSNYFKFLRRIIYDFKSSGKGYPILG